MTEARRLVRPKCHEFAANFNYNDHGLRPWFAFDRAVKDAGGSAEAQVESLGETWDVTLYYQDSPVVPPTGGETPAGTSIDHDKIREFRIHAVANDGLGEKKANYHIRPRWRDMVADPDDGDRTKLSVPDDLANDHTDAVNVRVQGSNIPFREYDDLLRDAADAFGINSRYFSDRHQTSNVQDAARYVRLHRDLSGPIHAREGPLQTLAHVLEGDRDGYRKLVQNDRDEHDNRLPGYYHTATLGPDRVREVFPSHSLPVELKHYYAKEALDRQDSDPLAHPKLEAAYQVGRWNDTLTADDDGLAQLLDELDRWLYSVLQDAGLDLRAGDGDPYVADHYFEPENHFTESTPATLDLTEIRHEQESVVYKHLADGMSPVERETLQTLVTDGGEVAPSDVAEQNDRHEDSVYRALQGMHDLVNHTYDSLELKSTYVAELVADALQQAEDAVANATLATAEAQEAERRGMDEKTSAWVAFRERYGVNFTERDDGVTLDLGELDPDVNTPDRDTPHPSDAVKAARREVREILREGYDLWTAMRRDELPFRTGRWKARVEVPTEHSALRSTDTYETETRYLGGDVWKLLD